MISGLSIYPSFRSLFSEYLSRIRAINSLRMDKMKQETHLKQRIVIKLLISNLAVGARSSCRYLMVSSQSIFHSFQTIHNSLNKASGRGRNEREMALQHSYEPDSGIPHFLDQSSSFLVHYSNTAVQHLLHCKLNEVGCSVSINGICIPKEKNVSSSNRRWKPYFALVLN